MPLSSTFCQRGKSFSHDAAICPCCVHINMYYKVFKPALARRNKLNCSSSSGDHETCGILTFLDGCLRFGFITDHAKSNVSSKGNPQQSFDYSSLLESIVNSKEKFNSRPSYSANIRALLYKYREKAVKTDVYKRRSPSFSDCLEDAPSTDLGIYGKKRRTSKRLFEKCFDDPALLKKHKRTPLETDETNVRAPKCLRDNPPALPNKGTRKTGKTNGTKQSLEDNCPKDLSSRSRGKKSKAPEPKSKKVTVFEKIPTKGSLKRRRYFIQQLESKEYPGDDIYEDSVFRCCYFDEDSQSSSHSYVRSNTPTWNCTPSPRAESFFSDSEDSDTDELKLARKRGEEYYHQRKKWRKNAIKNAPPTESPPSSRSKSDALKEDPQSQPSCSYTTLKTPLKDEDYDSDESRDNYPENSEENDCGPNV